MVDFIPWQKYPDLERDRLIEVAQIIAAARKEVVMLHAPGDGDGEWSLGCRSYERICFSLKMATTRFPWLRILPDRERALRFIFAVGNIPCRFYKGKAEDTPSKYISPCFVELRQQSLLEEMGAYSPSGAIRFAVEAPAGGQVSAVTLVEINEDGEPSAQWEIPYHQGVNKVVTMEAKPINLEAPIVQPLKEVKQKESEQKRDASGQ